MKSQTFFDDKDQNNITNNINISNNNDIISQSTIILQKENIKANNLEKNNSIMNFNPNASKSMEYQKDEITGNKYLNINLVSRYISLIII